jgi:uncharacterized protein YggE
MLEVEQSKFYVLGYSDCRSASPNLFSFPGWFTAKGGTKMATDCPTLTIEGVGLASAMPDLARISVRIISQGKKASDARRSCAEQADTILRHLERAGLPREDVRTAFYEVAQIRDWRKGDERVIGCRASTTIAVTLRKPEELGRIIDETLDLGPDVTWSALFAMSDEGEVKADAFGEAVKDARRKAEKMAAAAGLEIKRVLSIKPCGIEELLQARRGTRFEEEGLAYKLALAERITTEPREEGPVQVGLREYLAKVTMEFEVG